MRGLFEGARTIKPGQKWLRELFKGAVFSRARSDQGNTVIKTENFHWVKSSLFRGLIFIACPDHVIIVACSPWLLFTRFSWFNFLFGDSP